MKRYEVQQKVLDELNDQDEFICGNKRADNCACEKDQCHVKDWLAISISERIAPPEFYCQSDIESKLICKEQCEHCKEYYAPLEKLNNEQGAKVSDTTKAQ